MKLREIVCMCVCVCVCVCVWGGGCRLDYSNSGEGAMPSKLQQGNDLAYGTTLVF
jgi:hypothetical protein